jgi:hypothetical protein
MHSAVFDWVYYGWYGMALDWDGNGIRKPNMDLGIEPYRSIEGDWTSLCKHIRIIEIQEFRITGKDRDTLAMPLWF